MEKLVIQGNKKLHGEVTISGAKNAALKAIVAACLTEEEVIIHNIPLISDFFVMVEIIKQLGGDVVITDHTIKMKMTKFSTHKITLEKAAEIRTSSLLIAPLLARMGEAIMPNPGGCRIGARPIDRIIDALRQLGAAIEYTSDDGYYHAKAPQMHGATIRFEKNTHTGTETLIMASVLAKGKTVIENAAQEPEVDELIALLTSMGATIIRTQPRTIEIVGVEKLHGTEFTIGPDRNELVTFAIAGIITGGDITILGVKKDGIEEFLKALHSTEAGYEETNRGMRFFAKESLQSTTITTSQHPGFMTDWQGPWVVLMTKATGGSVMHETVYENRFSYVSELIKMGAHIELFNPEVVNPHALYNFNVHDDKEEFFHAAKIHGPVQLHNAIVKISDLRAGATLVLAALAAKGESVIFGLEHLDRGYEAIESRLRQLGAQIERVHEV